MSDLWSHQFCLACDKQVESDSAAYCSESCRLAELERTSTPCSQASSPGFTPSSYHWGVPARQPSPAKFSLTSSTPASRERAATSAQDLSPSSSHASLCSMQSASLTDLSPVAREELRAYAVSFEHVRSQRRRSQ